MARQSHTKAHTKAERESKHAADVEASAVPKDESAASAEQETDAVLAETEDSIDALKNRVEDLENKVLRARADYQNFQRRAQSERSEAIQYANAEFARPLLAVVDDFERALQAAERTDNLEAVVEGVRLVYENLVKALREHGVTEIDPQFAMFDPNVHEAMMRQPTAEHPPGTILEVIAKGYQLRDRVIRPAKVIVAGPPTDSEQRG